MFVFLNDRRGLEGSKAARLLCASHPPANGLHCPAGQVHGGEGCPHGQVSTTLQCNVSLKNSITYTQLEPVVGSMCARAMVNGISLWANMDTQHVDSGL